LDMNTSLHTRKTGSVDDAGDAARLRPPKCTPPRGARVCDSQATRLKTASCCSSGTRSSGSMTRRPRARRHFVRACSTLARLAQTRAGVQGVCSHQCVGTRRRRDRTIGDPRSSDCSNMAGEMLGHRLLRSLLRATGLSTRAPHPSCRAAPRASASSGRLLLLLQDRCGRAGPGLVRRCAEGRA